MCVLKSIIDSPYVLNRTRFWQRHIQKYGIDNFKLNSGHILTNWIHQPSIAMVAIILPSLVQLGSFKRIKSVSHTKINVNDMY